MPEKSKTLPARLKRLSANKSSKAAAYSRSDIVHRRRSRIRRRLARGCRRLRVCTAGGIAISGSRPTHEDELIVPARDVGVKRVVLT
jgi:hypothetical protein